MAASRSIEIILRPIDQFARGTDGRPHRADPIPGIIRILGTVHQRELAPQASPDGLYWVVTPLSAQDSVDFQLFREVLRSRGLVAMGAVPDARRGGGAVLVVPTDAGFALHSIDQTSPSGPFERLFSMRAMTMLVADWADLVAPDPRRRPGALPGTKAKAQTVLGGSTEPRGSARERAEKKENRT